MNQANVKVSFYLGYHQHLLQMLLFNISKYLYRIFYICDNFQKRRLKKISYFCFEIILK